MGFKGKSTDFSCVAGRLKPNFFKFLSFFGYVIHPNRLLSCLKSETTYLLKKVNLDFFVVLFELEKKNFFQSKGSRGIIHAEGKMKPPKPAPQPSSSSSGLF